MKKNNLLLILLPTIGVLMVLIALIIFMPATTKVRNKLVDWKNYESKFAYRNLKKIKYEFKQGVSLYKLGRTDFSSLNYLDRLESGSNVDHYLYSIQNNPTGKTRLITVLQSNGLISGLVYSGTGACLDEFELAGKGENEKGKWESYGEFINDSTYRYTKVVFEKNSRNGTLSLVDSVTHIHEIAGLN